MVRCEYGWTARDLSDSLRVRTTVPVHLFYRVLDCDELVRNLGRDRVVSMRGRVLGGSRNVSPFWENGLVLVVCGQGAGRLRTRAFVAVRHVPIPLCPLDQCRISLVRLGRLQGELQEMRQASSAASPSSVPTDDGLSLDLVFQFLRALNVPPAVLMEIQNAVPPPAPKKTAQQITKEQRCSQLRSKVDITKQQLAKLFLAKEHIEVAEKVMAKQTELAQLEVELEDARRLIMQPTPPPTPPSSQAPHIHTSPRVSDVASSGMAVDAELLLPTEGEVKGPKRLRVGTTGEEAPSLQQVLAAQDTFSLQDLESIMDSFRQHHSQLEEELIASDQCDLEDALRWSG